MAGEIQRGSWDGTGGPNGSSIQVYSGGSSREINSCEPLFANYQSKSYFLPYFYQDGWSGMMATNTEGMIKEVYITLSR